MVAAKSRMRKVRDNEAKIRCASGPGLLREEVWEDEHGRVVRYNLAFINRYLVQKDNGRVLGYDSAHGSHHRHFKGAVEPCEFVSYAETLERFIEEVSKLRKEKP